MIGPIHNLSTATLRTLSGSLRDGSLSLGISRLALQQIAGSNAALLENCLKALIAGGMTTSQISILVEAVADARMSMPDATSLFELVLSGPDTPGIYTADTWAVTHTLFEEAQTNVLLVGYAVHNGKQLFERLSERMTANPELRVVICLDIPRKWNDNSLATEIVSRFAHEFQEKHWPRARLPELYYDPRSTSTLADKRSSLHAKCIVVDNRVALITSANFTEAAQLRNIEAGVLVKHLPFVDRLVRYFEGLRETGALVRCQLR